MVSRLVKILGATAIIALAGNFSYRKVNDNSYYERVYRQFRREVSSLQTPNPDDNPTCQEWSTACSETGIPYDSRSKEEPRPSNYQIRKWLNDKGIWLDGEGNRKN